MNQVAGGTIASLLNHLALGEEYLKDGDQIRIAGSREFEISRDRSWKAAIERLRRLRHPLPSGFTFNRAVANER